MRTAFLALALLALPAQAADVYYDEAVASEYWQRHTAKPEDAAIDRYFVEYARNEVYRAQAELLRAPQPIQVITNCVTNFGYTTCVTQ